jgi:hypothetical protein
MQDERDDELLRLFQETPELPVEPFLADLLRRLEKERMRRVWLRRLLTAAVLSVCVAMTSYVIDGSMFLCGELTWLLQVFGQLLVTPAGGVALTVSLLLWWLFLQRAHLARFV